MRRKIISPVVITAAVFIAPMASAEAELWQCPDGEEARQAIISGEIESWPNYAAGVGMRVQLQHPKTALRGQAKYLKTNGRDAAICQYYNHVGYVATMVALDVPRAKNSGKAYWRKEYIESYEKDDDPNNLMMDVCMMDSEGVASMSIECPFVISDAE